MNETTFWTLIDKSREESSKEAQCEYLRERLRGLGTKEVTSFQALLDEAVDRAFTWDLFAALFIISKKESPEDFLDFRSWLVSKGSKRYRKAIENADSLKEITPNGHECFFPELLYVAFEVWTELTGKGIDEYPDSGSSQPPEPFGEEWKHEGLKDRLPGLYSHYSQGES